MPLTLFGALLNVMLVVPPLQNTSFAVAVTDGVGVTLTITSFDTLTHPDGVTAYIVYVAVPVLFVVADKVCAIGPVTGDAALPTALAPLTLLADTVQ